MIESIQHVQSRRNSYGNVESIPTGWLSTSMITKAARVARDKGAAIQVVTGWRRGLPVLVWYIHPKWQPQPYDEHPKDPKKVAASKKAAATRRSRKEADAIRKFEDLLQKVKPELRDILRRHRTWGTYAIQHLQDVNEAHPEWLRELLQVCEESHDRGGIMYAWVQGRCDLDYYPAAKRALAASRRHNYTDYDEQANALMSSLSPRERREDGDYMLRQLRQIKTTEGAIRSTP